MNKEEYWREVHACTDRPMLGCSKPPNILRYHRLAGYLSKRRNLSIMDIGIGLGDMARHLKRMGMQVYCVDISSEAFKRVSNISKKCMTTKELLDIDPIGINIGISQLVIQHCSNEETVALLRGCIHHLRTDGFLSIQFASPWRQSNYKESVELIEKDLLFFRTPKEFTELAERANGRIMTIGNMRKFESSWGFKWHVARIAKR